MTSEKKKILKGIAASAGMAEGIVRIVHGAQDVAKFGDGDVLVAAVTEPNMVIMMNKAAAIITDHGGLTSHAAIVSRELGVPCVSATETATQDLSNGDKVRVDGDVGMVYVL